MGYLVAMEIRVALRWFEGEILKGKYSLNMLISYLPQKNNKDHHIYTIKT